LHGHDINFFTDILKIIKIERLLQEIIESVATIINNQIRAYFHITKTVATVATVYQS